MADDARNYINNSVGKMNEYQLDQFLIGLKIISALPIDKAEQFVDLMKDDQITVDEAAERFGFSVSELSESPEAVQHE